MTDLTCCLRGVAVTVCEEKAGGEGVCGRKGMHRKERNRPFHYCTPIVQGRRCSLCLNLKSKTLRWLARAGLDQVYTQVVYCLDRVPAAVKANRQGWQVDPHQGSETAPK